MPTNYSNIYHPPFGYIDPRLRADNTRSVAAAPIDTRDNKNHWIDPRLLVATRAVAAPAQNNGALSFPTGTPKAQPVPGNRAPYNSGGTFQAGGHQEPEDRAQHVQDHQRIQAGNVAPLWTNEYQRIKARTNCPTCRTFAAGAKSVYAAQAAKTAERRGSAITSNQASAARRNSELRFQQETLSRIRHAGDRAAASVVQSKGEDILLFIIRAQKARAEAEAAWRKRWGVK